MTRRSQYFDRLALSAFADISFSFRIFNDDTYSYCETVLSRKFRNLILLNDRTEEYSKQFLLKKCARHFGVLILNTKELFDV